MKPTYQQLESKIAELQLALTEQRNELGLAYDYGEMYKKRYEHIKAELDFIVKGLGARVEEIARH